ncbi:HAMP domain-containing sensor histidine kinase [Tepidibacter hydrothermalis]|uniref:histidine kinase n=1 Tax=Tepidibacter hydrothermalis TaxID=3036126 RepID=A0ABY8ECS3_9FIRM|nr:HAMP domain-containing sensor histidine kinase [Tepidibacter hydrothermalis]WFD10721.1 HAMP domain-containing sensor histidine kinase [Tepidibacter hydrothermalis]
MKSIKSRIYRQNGIIIIGIVLILEIIFLANVRSYYFESVRNELTNKANISSLFYNKILISEKIDKKARYILEDNSKDKVFYMQVINLSKMMITDSYGLNSIDILESEDILEALKGNKKVIQEVDEKTNEKIMSISVPLYYLDNISGVLRYSVSVEDIDKTFFQICMISILVGIIVIIITFLFSSFLAKEIVYPIEELTDIAQVMALGDFSKKAVKRNKDEIGRLADTLNYMSEEIQKSNLVKNEFISSVSHELRTPLTSIQGWSEIMLTGDVDNEEETKEGLQIIYDESKRLTGLVEELLDFSKFESGKIDLDLENIDVNKLIISIYNYFKKRLKKENIELILDIDEKPYYIKGDINRLKQVFINIIDNSIKFSNENAVISIKTRSMDKFILIEIQDNGTGISKEDLDKVTDKFYKGNSKQSGSGIGLAICKEIVSMHKGEFNIDSVYEEGTKVSIKIPRL